MLFGCNDFSKTTARSQCLLILLDDSVLKSLLDLSVFPVLPTSIIPMPLYSHVGVLPLCEGRVMSEQ